MKKLKVLAIVLFFLNFLLLLTLLILEINYSQSNSKFEVLVSSNLSQTYKIKILDSDDGLYDKANGNSVDKKNISTDKEHNLEFILPEQNYFWNRWQYSLLSSMSDEHFYSALTQVRDVRFYNSGYLSNQWVSDLYSPIVLNDRGKLDLEILLISWVLSKNHYKFTIQYDFYRADTDQRYLEHVVNIVTPR